MTGTYPISKASRNGPFLEKPALLKSAFALPCTTSTEAMIHPTAQSRGAAKAPGPLARPQLETQGRAHTCRSDGRGLGLWGVHALYFQNLLIKS